MKEIMGVEIKQEINEQKEMPEPNRTSTPASVIDISSTDSDSNSDDSDDEWILRKKRNLDCLLPIGFLAPLRPEERMNIRPTTEESSAVVQSCRQFWRAKNFEEDTNAGDFASASVGMDHVPVHPRFLHSNATSHKWVLGAFAALLDNSLDEFCNGATYVHIDTLENKRDNSKMLLVEDDGGGMTPDKMRQCMSLGYSVKSNMANTIGQYGNGFKTSTMRLGADVIVFSRCPGADGRSRTQSIGMLSCTFLRNTGSEDIVVPMIHYEGSGEDWNKLMPLFPNGRVRNLETILQWSPYESEEDLLQQFGPLKERGTRIIIYNLWEDDEGQLELDFDTDQNDIQIRGVNRDEKKIEMAKDYTNSKHFLSYRHSLRNYASILYLRIPPGFRILLRGKDIDHHKLVNDMMYTKQITCRPVAIADEMPKDPNTFAVVTLGFVKDVKYHIDIQGFNVYHKNRLIKPFWRVCNAAGSDGCGVIGALEDNFVEPAHDKQGFDHTTALARLEARLVAMQKTYWSANCHVIGYAKRRRRSNKSVSTQRDCTPSDIEKSLSPSTLNGHLYSDGGSKLKSAKRNEKGYHSDLESEVATRYPNHKKSKRCHYTLQKCMRNGKTDCIAAHPHSEVADLTGVEHASSNSNAEIIVKLEGENRVLRERSEQADGLMVIDMLSDLRSERDKCQLLETKIEVAQRKIEEMYKEHESLVDISAKERKRRDAKEDSLRSRLKDASNTIQELVEKVKLLESRRVKTER